mgnify:CR=1 FL=1
MTVCSNITSVNYLLITNADFTITRNVHFPYLANLKTPLMVTAAQQNITTVYITTLTYGRNTFDLKAIPSQTDITEQQFSEAITVIVQSSIKS